MNLTCLRLQENLSEIRQENVKLTLNQQLIRFSAHLAAWVVSTGVAIACCVAVYYLADNNSQVTRKLEAWVQAKGGGAGGARGGEPAAQTGVRGQQHRRHLEAC